MKISRKKSHMLLVVVVAGIFAAASACLAVLGVFIYKTAASDQSQQDLSHASEYLQKQARSCSDAGDLRIATLSGQISALVLSERKNGEDRELWIFVEDGYLRRDGFCKGRKKDHAASVDGSANYRVGSFRNFDAERIGFGCMPGLDPGDRRRK